MAAMTEDMAAMVVVMVAAMIMDTEAMIMNTMENIMTLIYSTQNTPMSSNVSYFLLSTSNRFLKLVLYVSTVPKEFKKLFKLDDFGYHNNDYGYHNNDYGYHNNDYDHHNNNYGGNYGGASYGAGYNNNNYPTNNYNNNDQYSNQYATGYGDKYRQADASPTNPAFPSMTIPSIMNAVSPHQQIPEMHLSMVTILYLFQVLFLSTFQT